VSDDSISEDGIKLRQDISSDTRYIYGKNRELKLIGVLDVPQQCKNNSCYLTENPEISALFKNVTWSEGMFV
jgi:hypothetical protein